ncbi:type I-E CRISPR-associated protein Cse2/CasB [Jonesiaceae bacterium BS-20]|uniref:Type I-E CRISPR-associated protein Cse2/CasB n=1 Tax=Jonesiaceae bacterium BS-20 TaxID=3120821 RepID=A0AAU7DWG5_9MICO
MTSTTSADRAIRHESGFGRALRGKLHQFWEGRESSSTKASLARLRRTVTSPLEECTEIWDVVLPDLPNSMGKFGDAPTFEERAAHLCLALYATHQQSKSASQHVAGNRWGQSVNALAQQVPTTQTRFATLLAVGEFAELSNHLMSLVTQMRAKDIPTDYVALGQDLLEFQVPSRRSAVLLRWSRQFYNPPRKDNRTEQILNETGE